MNDNDEDSDNEEEEEEEEEEDSATKVCIFNQKVKKDGFHFRSLLRKLRTTKDQMMMNLMTIKKNQLLIN